MESPSGHPTAFGYPNVRKNSDREGANWRVPFSVTQTLLSGPRNDDASVSGVTARHLRLEYRILVGCFFLTFLAVFFRLDPQASLPHLAILISSDDPNEEDPGSCHTP
jgi:hypothetical protein